MIQNAAIETGLTLEPRNLRAFLPANPQTRQASVKMNQTYLRQFTQVISVISVAAGGKDHWVLSLAGEKEREGYIPLNF